MTLRRAIPLVLVLAAAPLQPALAQFGGMPGMPGSPGSPGMGGPGMGGGGFGAAPPPQQQGPPPVCQQLLVVRDEVQKHGQALQAAGKKKAGPEVACKLFKAFLASETKMIKGLEQHSSTCGVPGDVIKQLKTSHAQAEKAGKQVCDAAAQGPPQAAGPSLSDALGTTPTVPDASAPKRGAGTFETLTGNPLQR